MAKGKSSKARLGAKSNGEPMCTFCCKSHKQIDKLIGGPGIYICDQCVGLCNEILADEQYQDASTGWQGWASMADSELLATLPGSLRSVENVRDGLQARINELRRREVSWAKIGKALDMSRQAAWERFA